MRLRARLIGTAILGAAALAGASAARADKIKHPTVVFAGLDKITGRIITFDVAVNETVQFGTLQITPRVCYTRPPTEAPQTTTFAEVDDIGDNGEAKRIFSGWMFAASPGLHGVEHPVYDVWLKDCKGGKEIIPSPPETADLRDEAPPPQAQPQPAPRAARQQARPVTPGASPETGAGPATTPSLGQAIEVGPPPGSRSVAPPPPVVESQVPAAPARQPSSRRGEAPLVPPANIPSAR